MPVRHDESDGLEEVMTRRRALAMIILLIFFGLLSALAGVLFGLVQLPEFITSHPLVALLLVGVALGVFGYLIYRVQSPAEKLPLRKQIYSVL